MAKFFILSGGLFAALAVMAGAFGAHALKTQLDEQMLSVFKTGVDYHIYHALGLILIGMLIRQMDASSLLNWAGGMMLLGIILFSGSLYILSISGIRWLGAITPFGGLAFIVSWMLLVLGIWRS